MADTKDSVFDKAESAARRILERLGSKVDSKLASGTQTLTTHAIGNLTSQIEHLVESNLTADESGIRRLAPNRFKVLFTYEETSAFSPQYIEAVGKELTASVFEYINNRRYRTRGAVEVATERDLFVKKTVVKVSLDGDRDQPMVAPQASPASRAATVSFTNANGQSYRVELKPDGAPAYIGRAAGSAMRIDDPSVSRFHCSLSLRSGGSVLIADVGSANGTTVNEQPLSQEEARLLKAGDVVGVGDFKLTVAEIG